MTRLWADDPGSDSGQVKRILLISETSRPVGWSTQLFVLWVPEDFSPMLKMPECEADNSYPSNVEVKMRGAIHLLPSYTFIP